MIRFSVVGCFCALLLGCGPVVPAAVDDAAADDAVAGALLDAPVDTSHPFDVGVCQGPVNTDPTKGPVGTCRSGTAKCSGTLIAPNLVLTARHCIAGLVPGPEADANPCDADFTPDVVRAGGTRITTSPSLFVGSPKFYEVKEIVVPTNTRACEADIALLILASKVPSSEARYVGVDLKRDLATWRTPRLAVVGRGAVGETFELDANGDWTGATTTDRGDLMRRVQEHIAMTCVTNGPKACTTVDHEVPTTHVYTASLRQFLMGPGLASGDSGAGVFDQGRFSAFGGRYAKAVGVATWNFIGPDGNTNGAGAQRIDQFADLIRQTAETARQLGDYRQVWWLANEGD